MYRFEFSCFSQLDHLTLECVYAHWGLALTLLLIIIVSSWLLLPDTWLSIMLLIISWNPVVNATNTKSDPANFWTHSCDQAGKNPIVDTCCKSQSITIKPQIFTVTTLIQFGVRSSTHWTQSTTNHTESHRLQLLFLQFIFCQAESKTNVYQINCWSDSYNKWQTTLFVSWNSISWGLTPVRKCVLIILP